MKKVLFLIHDLGEGGAEKVLVNLVNNMDYTLFDITLMSIFDVGVNREFISDKVKYVSCFSKMLPGNSKVMKLFTPSQLHKKLIRETYDIEIAYLEGPCTRIISGCSNLDTKLISWVHREADTRFLTASFRSVKEAEQCYDRLDHVVCVSEKVKQTVLSSLNINVPVSVYYNTNESSKIVKLSREKVEDCVFDDHTVKLVGVGKLLKSKGFDRLLKIVRHLKEKGFSVALYILGAGPEEQNLRAYIEKYNLENQVKLLGYQTNPYKYVSRCDLFVCASHAEGFSTAATEALIVGTPICTVDVSGMKEMLGDHNEYGVVTENTDQALYNGIRMLISDKEELKRYRCLAEIRGKSFSTEVTVKEVEKLLNSF